VCNSDINNVQVKARAYRYGQLDDWQVVHAGGPSFWNNGQALPFRTWFPIPEYVTTDPPHVISKLQCITDKKVLTEFGWSCVTASSTC
jgi:hypothetical protein